jgi:hypothetical protein
MACLRAAQFDNVSDNACGPGAADAAGEVDILHQRPVRVAAGRVVEPARQQQALVTVGQPEAARAPGGTAFQRAGGQGRIVEPQPAIAGAHGVGRVGGGGGDGALPAARQHGAGMQEQQPRAVGRRGAGAQLRAAAGWRTDDPAARTRRCGSAATPMPH